MSFLLAANAFAEEVPIRWFLRRFAIAFACVPPLLWWIGEHPDDGSLMVVGFVALLFGWRALRHLWWL